VDTGEGLGLLDASTTALEDAFDSILTAIETGADMLLSMAVPDALSDPFSPAQGGWFAAWQNVDPYTNAPGSSDSIRAFVGEDVNAYTGTAPGEGNTNPFTEGRDINPFTGSQNGSAFAVDEDVAKPSLILASAITPGANEGSSEKNDSANEGGPENTVMVYRNGIAYSAYQDEQGQWHISPFFGPLTPEEQQIADQTRPQRQTAPQQQAQPQPSARPQAQTAPPPLPPLPPPDLPPPPPAPSQTQQSAPPAPAPSPLPTPQSVPVGSPTGTPPAPVLDWDGNPLTWNGSALDINEVLRRSEQASAPTPFTDPLLQSSVTNSPGRLETALINGITGTVVDLLKFIIAPASIGSPPETQPPEFVESFNRLKSGLRADYSYAPYTGGTPTQADKGMEWFFGAAFNFWLGAGVGEVGELAEVGELGSAQTLGPDLGDSAAQSGAQTLGLRVRSGIRAGAGSGGGGFVPELDALEPDEIAAGNDLLAPGTPSGGTAANPIKGVIGNETSAYLFQEIDRGAVLLGKEVGVRVNGTLTYLDNLFLDSDGNLVGIEAKFGQYARDTPNQRLVYPQGGGWVVAVPEGPAAVRAGLVEDQPTMIYLFRMKFNWPLGGP